MRLLTPSPGEVFDRVSILEIKIAVGTRQKKDVTAFEAEKDALRDYMVQWEHGLKEQFSVAEPKDYDAICAQIKEKKTGLMGINALLWDAEDQVRAANWTEISRLASLCLRIAKLNDGRANLVRELSVLYGAEDHQEKLYVTTSQTST